MRCGLDGVLETVLAALDRAEELYAAACHEGYWDNTRDDPASPVHGYSTTAEAILSQMRAAAAMLR